MVLSKNTDLTLPASHTLKITFTPTATPSSSSEAPRFDQRINTIVAPQFKDQKDGRGAPLIGQTVPVLPNIFLIGLSNEGDDQAYNLNLLKSQKLYKHHTACRLNWGSHHSSRLCWIASDCKLSTSRVQRQKTHNCSSKYRNPINAWWKHRTGSCT